MPEHLVENKTEISEDGAISEIVHEVKKSPGLCRMFADWILNNCESIF